MRSTLKGGIRTLLVLTLLLSSHSSLAGPIILTVSGNLAGTPLHFDIEALESLPQHSFRTNTPWTEDSHLYQGVLLNDLLDHVKAGSDQLTAIALNDYRVKIDLAPLKDYPAIIALKRNGRYMRVRDKGPLWILYPMSDHPELDQPKHHASLVWQLRELRIH